MSSEDIAAASPSRRQDGAQADLSRLDDAPLVFFMNAGSGQGEAEETRAVIRRVVEAAGRRLHFELIDAAVDDVQRGAREAAAKARELRGVLVAVGGDGTINVVAAAALAAGVPLGVIPQGTFNYFGRNLGISTELEGALDTLLHPHLRQFRIGQAGEKGKEARQVFLVSASLGFYPKIIEDREFWKQQLGRRRIVALWSGLMTLLREHRTLRLSLRDPDGQIREVKTSTLLVSDNALQMANLGLPEAGAIYEGQLAALVLRATSRWQLLGLALRGALRRLTDDSRLERFTFERLEVAVRQPSPDFRFKVAIDGEISTFTSPMVFEVAPEPLLVLAPRPAEISDEARAARQAYASAAQQQA